MKKLTLLVIILTFFISCKKDKSVENDVGGGNLNILSVQLKTDKALYNPGEAVTFESDKSLGNNIYIKYYFLGNLIDEIPAAGKSWTWEPPLDDFRGYMVEVVDKSRDNEVHLGSIAVDVSSDWKRFPRYGFLSHYGEMSDAEIEKNIEKSHPSGGMTLNGLAKIMLFQRLKLEVRVRLARFQKLRFVLLQET